MKAVLVMLLVVLILLQVRLWVGAGSIAEIVRLENAIDDQNTENAKLEARNGVLKEDVSDLRNGLDSIEERARNELGLIRQGETFYLIVDEEPEARPVPEPETVRAEPAAEEVPPEPPPEIADDDNPYLEMFRDDEPRSAQAPANGQTADQ
jgi:cell division protein FtsB